MGGERQATSAGEIVTPVHERACALPVPNRPVDHLRGRCFERRSDPPESTNVSAQLHMPGLSPRNPPIQRRHPSAHPGAPADPGGVKVGVCRCPR